MPRSRLKNPSSEESGLITGVGLRRGRWSQSTKTLVGEGAVRGNAIEGEALLTRHPAVIENSAGEARSEVRFDEEDGSVVPRVDPVVGAGQVKDQADLAA